MTFVVLSKISELSEVEYFVALCAYGREISDFVRSQLICQKVLPNNLLIIPIGCGGKKKNRNSSAERFFFSTAKM